MGQTATLAPAVAKDTLFSSPAHQEPSGPAARDRRTARAATNASRPLGPRGRPAPCPQGHLMGHALGGWGVAKRPKTPPLISTHLGADITDEERVLKWGSVGY